MDGTSCTRKEFVSLLAAGSALAVAGCVGPDSPHALSAEEQPTKAKQEAEPEVEEPAEPEVDLDEFEKLAIDMDAWKFDSENGVFYQLGIPYCLDPASETYESLAIFVPGAYLTAKAHGRTYSCTVNERTTVGSFTAHTAPVLMPINSGTLNAQVSPTSYSHAGLEDYLKAGFVYVYAGFRGRTAGFESAGSGAYSGGDPWPVVDFKAAVRYLRYNASVLPGDMNRIFTCGFSMGGGMSALMGASGDSELFLPYLEEIGAATHDAEGESLSDATCGSASWCPITSFDAADAAYEWMMGQYVDTGTRADGTWTSLLSRDLAVAYGNYVNEIGLCDASGQRLSLDETSGEVFADGTYYAYLVNLIQESATAFFENTAFPYTFTPQHVLNASFPGDPALQSAGAGSADVDMVTGDASAQAAGVGMGESRHGEGMMRVQSVVYNTQSDYVNDLNAEAWWLTFNETRATVRISSIGDFVRHLKDAAKDVGAFDAPDRSTVVNQLFGVDDSGSLHFSGMMRDLIVQGSSTYAKGEGFDAAYVQDWTGDLDVLDSLGTDMQTRVGMFNPLYFLSETYKGAGSSVVAPHWRVNSGLFQTDTSLCTEANLALALDAHEKVTDVAFTPVWGQGHVLAEVTGTAEANLIAWIVECCKENSSK